METDRTPTTERPKRRLRFRVTGALAGVLAVAAVLLAACGGTTGSSSPTTAGSGSGSPGSSSNGGLLAYSQCMRSHGVADFPDPNSKGVIEGKSSSQSADGINPNSPTYQAAQKACEKYVSGGTTPAMQKQQLNQALKYSACMRAHGLTDYPDPTIKGGQISFNGSGGVGRSPQFQSANSACQHYLEGSGS